MVSIHLYARQCRYTDGRFSFAHLRTSIGINSTSLLILTFILFTRFVQFCQDTSIIINLLATCR